MRQYKENDRASRVLRECFPYGMLQEKSGKVVLFNRNYQVLTFAGVCEFDLDPEEMGDIFDHICFSKTILRIDGNCYFGKMFFLYEEATSPLYFDRKLLVRYLNKWQMVMSKIINNV